MWTVLCDFDGTVTLKDTTDAVLAAFANPHWHVIESQWEQGDIGAAECMRRQVELIGASLPEIEAFLDTVPLDPHFPAFVDYCQTQGILLMIVSDGVDYFIHYLLKRYGLDHLPVRANQLRVLDQRRYSLDCPDNAICAVQAGTCKCALAQAARQRTLLIGDGRSDFCVAHQADVVFAKHRLLEYSITHALPHRAFTDFHDVRQLMQELVAMEIPHVIDRDIPAHETALFVGEPL